MVVPLSRESDDTIDPAPPVPRRENSSPSVSDPPPSNPLEREVARLYSALWEGLPTIRGPEILRQFLANVSLPEEWFEGKVCLDAGCGSGFAAWAMRRLGAVAVACDLDFDALRAAREKIGGEEDPPRIVAGSALALPFAAESFDFVHCNGVLHHTVDPRRGFSELVRVARTGGTVFVSLYGKGGLYGAFVAAARLFARIFPRRLAKRLARLVLRDRRIPGSFMPARLSALDNLYVPIRRSYREREIRRWFAEEGFEARDVVRTRSTIYDHRKLRNRLFHGEGYLQFRAVKRSPNGLRLVLPDDRG
jgi:SAM-dependent methyltransferase